MLFLVAEIQLKMSHADDVALYSVSDWLLLLHEKQQLTRDTIQISVEVPAIDQCMVESQTSLERGQELSAWRETNLVPRLSLFPPLRARGGLEEERPWEQGWEEAYDFV